VGFREWFYEGHLDYEQSYMVGLRHGNVYEFYPNGRLRSKETYRDGRLHGTGRQWSREGRLLVMWKFVNGCGLDLWCDSETGSLSEEFYCPREGELGFKRQWNDDEKTVYEEYYFLSSGYHGIWRQWNQKGKLRRGFPQFYVNNRKVTSPRYRRACERDASLVPYRVEDDDWSRTLPPEYLTQRRK
jgi:antitoxin component YwqK of YwqJK toxin-antitoxin module